MSIENAHIHKLDRRQMQSLLDRICDIMGVEHAERTEKNIMITIDREFKRWLHGRRVGT